MLKIKATENGVNKVFPAVGQKIKVGETTKTLHDFDVIKLNGVLYDLGTVKKYITHYQTEEPTTGTTWYVSPNGSGTMTGKSWENAAKASEIKNKIGNNGNQNNVYFLEGEYEETIMAPSSPFSFYGGFKSENPSWETRDAFKYKTIVNSISSFSNCKAVDGIIFENVEIKISAENEIINCVIQNAAWNNIGISSNSIKNSVAINITYENGIIFAVGSGKNIENCVAVGCSSRIIFRTSGSGKILNCIAVNCHSTGINYGDYSIFWGEFSFASGRLSTIESCDAINCICETSVKKCTIYSAAFSSKCKAINCKCIINDLTTSSPKVNSIIFDSTAMNCIAVNCQTGELNSEKTEARIFVNGAENCTAVNCNVQGVDAAVFEGGKNCVSWNNAGVEFSGSNTTCAGSTESDSVSVVLGNDNTLAKFLNTGYAPQKGIISGNCPDPVEHPNEFAAYLFKFGDWHPAADSSLIGAGTADSSVTTDADGVTRPDPPAIGAYEAKPTQETTE